MASDSRILPAVVEAVAACGWKLESQKVRKCGPTPVGAMLKFTNGDNAVTVFITGKPQEKEQNDSQTNEA